MKNLNEESEKTQHILSPYEMKRNRYVEVEVKPAPIVENNLHEQQDLSDLFRKKIYSSLGQADKDREELYNRKKEELMNMNNKLLETETCETNSDNYNSGNPALK